MEAGLVKGAVLNVNIPVGGRAKGVRFVKQSTVGIDDQYRRQDNRDGQICYTMSREFKFRGPTPDTDVQALDEGFVTVTPLHFDLTNQEQLHILCGNQWDIHGK